MSISKHVICCGNIAFDLIAGRSNAPGSFSFYATPGGSVFNVAILLARLGLNVSVAAKTGTDFLGGSLVETMKRERIETKLVARDGRVKTGLALARIDEKGDSDYLFYKTEGPAVCFDKGGIPAGLFKKADVFHTGSAYSYDDHSWRDALDLAEKAKAAGVCVSYDPNWRSSRIKDISAARARVKILSGIADLLKLSGSDALGVFGTKTLDSALKKLGRDAFVTLGARGSFYWDGKRKLFRPAFSVKVADTIGAGDAYTAGLIYRYCEVGKQKFLEEMPRNLCLASAVSAIVCTSRGATTALKNITQVRNFLASRPHAA